MNCEQAQRAFDELIESGRLLYAGPDLEEHLASCAECRARYADELQAIGALETLESLPVPADFAERVLSRLPDAPPKPEPAPAPVREAPLHRIRLLWDRLVGELNRPASRRRLVPALAFAATLVLALGLLYGLQNGGSAPTPGAAIGMPLWAVGGGVVLVLALLAAVLVIWRRR